jgi:GntR family transcriptional regulator
VDFGRDRAIYLQIADTISENILSGQWHPGDRIPSVRELAVGIEVNPNTVLRTYAYLQDQGVIQNRRGIGYFVSEDALEKARELARRDFVGRELPRVFRTMDLLGMGLEELKLLRSKRGGMEGKKG